MEWYNIPKILECAPSDWKQIIVNARSIHLLLTCSPTELATQLGPTLSPTASYFVHVANADPGELHVHILAGSHACKVFKGSDQPTLELILDSFSALRSVHLLVSRTEVAFQIDRAFISIRGQQLSRFNSTGDSQAAIKMVASFYLENILDLKTMNLKEFSFSTSAWDGLHRFSGIHK